MKSKELSYNPLETLFIGIDVSKDSNQVCFMNFSQKKLASFSSRNNLDGAKLIEERILSVLDDNKELNKVLVILESTGIYSLHIANYLSTVESLISKGIELYVVNPVSTANYSKVLREFSKNDPNDAYALADFIRSGHTKDMIPFRGAQRLSLQRLTRHRKHIVELLSREKEYVLNNIFLKFSDFNNARHECRTFSNTFSETSTQVLLKFNSPEAIANMKLDRLVELLVKYSKNKFSNPEEVAKTLQKAARSSFRLDKTSYDSLNIAIASSLSLIDAYEGQIREIDEAISKLVSGLDNVNQYKALMSVSGIGPVFAAGILSEIGDANYFNSDDALAKYIGLTWKERQSGNYSSEDTPLTKAGNSYLRYYIIEATSSVICSLSEYADFYLKKKGEVTVHSHSRAIVLTSRKLVRLIYSLMSNNKLFQVNK